MKLKYKSVKYIIILIAVFVTTVNNYAIAQNRPPQDIRRVTVTFQFQIENGKYTDTFKVVNQEIYDSLDRCHTEIDYSLIDQYPHNYRWSTFNNKFKTKTEIFINEKLSSIEEFSYNPAGLLDKKLIKNVNSTDTSLFRVYTYTYDSNKNPIEVTVKTKEGKIAFSSKSTFDSKGKELTRKVKVKKNNYPQDSIIKLISVPIYDSIGRISSDKVTVTKANKPAQKKEIKYTYDQKGNLILVRELDATGKQICREEREYQYTRNRLSMIKTFDANDVLVKMISKRYELYLTKNRKERVIDY